MGPQEMLLPWQRDFAAALLRRRERWPAALLLTGRRGIGKRGLALFLARALLCERPGPAGLPCDECPGCGYASAGNHPDLRMLEPTVVDADGTITASETINVDRVREVVEFAQLSSHRQGRRLVIIRPAELMNPAAANALLKTLEEPPLRLHFILVSDQPGRLPATIVSRCERVAAPEPDAALAVAWLAAQGAEGAEDLLAQAGGAPLRALELAGGAGGRERAAVLEALAAPDRMSPLELGARIDAAPRDERKSRLIELVDVLLTWTADLAVVAAGGAPRFHPRQKSRLQALAPRVARISLLRYHETVTRQRALTAHPLQPRLFAESLLIEYRALFAPK